jgi:formamidopyrimidine-DNA glycosylase
MASRSDRHWVYHRTGEPCRVCGTPIVMEEIGGRKLYWCPKDQA